MAPETLIRRHSSNLGGGMTFCCNLVSPLGADLIPGDDWKERVRSYKSTAMAQLGIAL